MTNQFQVGRTYATRSICDYDCIFSFTILARTAKTVTTQIHGKTVRRGLNSGTASSSSSRSATTPCAPSSALMTSCPNARDIPTELRHILDKLGITLARLAHLCRVHPVSARRWGSTGVPDGPAAVLIRLLGRQSQRQDGRASVTCALCSCHTKSLPNFPPWTPCAARTFFTPPALN